MTRIGRPPRTNPSRRLWRHADTIARSPPPSQPCTRPDWTGKPPRSTLVRMSGVNQWTPVYLPLTREAFNAAARKARIPIRDRNRVFEWATYLEAKEGVWPSAAHAVHAWVTGQLARQSTKDAPPSAT